MYTLALSLDRTYLYVTLLQYSVINLTWSTHGCVNVITNACNKCLGEPLLASSIKQVFPVIITSEAYPLRNQQPNME